MRYSDMADHSEILFFSDFPSLQTLCSVKLLVPKPNGVNMAMASYQPQLIKAREFIFTEPEMIATPLLNTDRRMQIIMQQAVFRSGRLQARCDRLGMGVAEPGRVLPTDFQACLSYTLLARLAPLWNKTGDYLLQGRDFITNNQKMNAVKMELKVNVNELFLAVKAYQVRLPPITVRDLEIPDPVLADFMAERPNAVIFEYSIRHKWVYVLPSLKRGVVVSVHHRIPSDSPFKSYRDMKRYWKNTYGYRIPENDDGMLYYQLYFKPIGNKLFTYPECCVRGCDVTLLPRADSGAITAAFLADLHAKLPTVCGGRLAFCPRRAMQHTGRLTEAAQVDSAAAGPGFNLQAREAERYRPTPSSLPASTWKPSSVTYTDARHETHTAAGGSMQQSSTSLYPRSSQLSQANVRPPMSQVNNHPPMSQMAKLHDGSSVIDRSLVDYCTQEADIVSSSQSTPRSVAVNRRMAEGSDRVPQKISDLTQMSILAERTDHRQATHTAAQDSTRGEKDSSTQSGKIRPVFLPTARAHNMAQKRFPSFKPFNQPTASIAKGTLEQKAAKPKPTFKPKNPVFSAAAVKIPKPVFSNKAKLALPKPSVPKPQSLVPILSGAYGDVSSSGYESMAAPSPRTPMFIAATPKRAGLPGMSQSVSSLASTPSKRKIQGDGVGTPSLKKPRAKPKIQEMDIAALASCHQLGKANTATLLNWLKEKSVTCKSKDKKADIVSKVYAHLGIPEA